MYPTFNHRVFRAAQMHIVLIDKCLRNLDQRHLARQPAIIPPIGLQRGHAVVVARIIHGCYHKVTSRMNRRRNFAIEAGVPSLVLANLHAVHPEPRLIVGRAHMQKDPRMLFGLVSEILLVPDGPLIVIKRPALHIPVAGNFQRGRLGKIVLGRELIAGLSLAVEKIAVLVLSAMKAHESRKVRVNDGRPFAIERDSRPAIRASQDDRCGSRRSPGSRDAKQRGGNCGKSNIAGHPYIHVCGQANRQTLHFRASAFEIGWSHRRVLVKGIGFSPYINHALASWTLVPAESTPRGKPILSPAA